MNVLDIEAKITGIRSDKWKFSKSDADKWQYIEMYKLIWYQLPLR